MIKSDGLGLEPGDSRESRVRHSTNYSHGRHRSTFYANHRHTVIVLLASSYCAYSYGYSSIIIVKCLTINIIISS